MYMRARNYGWISCRLERRMGRGRIELSTWVPVAIARVGAKVELRLHGGAWQGPWEILSVGSWTDRDPGPATRVRPAVVARPRTMPQTRATSATLRPRSCVVSSAGIEAELG